VSSEYRITYEDFQNWFDRLVAELSTGMPEDKRRGLGFEYWKVLKEYRATELGQAFRGIVDDYAAKRFPTAAQMRQIINGSKSSAFVSQTIASGMMERARQADIERHRALDEAAAAVAFSDPLLWDRAADLAKALGYDTSFLPPRPFDSSTREHLERVLEDERAAFQAEYGRRLEMGRDDGWWS